MKGRYSSALVLLFMQQVVTSARAETPEAPPPAVEGSKAPEPEKEQPAPPAPKHEEKPQDKPEPPGVDAKAPGGDKAPDCGTEAPKVTAKATFPPDLWPSCDGCLSQHSAPKDPPPVAQREDPLSKVVVGAGENNLLDRWYLLFGANWAAPCQAAAFELETSVAYVGTPFLWGGVYGSGGYQAPRESDEDACTLGESVNRFDDVNSVYTDEGRGLRAGAGLEFGWRIFALDAGYIYNDALENLHGGRFRVGLAFAHEFFTVGKATFSRSKDCCKAEGSDTTCECPRTPIGVSIFAYYANEWYPWYPWGSEEVWYDGMIGISLKVGMGL